MLRNAASHADRHGHDCPSAPAMRHCGGADYSRPPPLATNSWTASTRAAALLTSPGLLPSDRTGHADAVMRGASTPNGHTRRSPIGRRPRWRAESAECLRTRRHERSASRPSTEIRFSRFLSQCDRRPDTGGVAEAIVSFDGLRRLNGATRGRPRRAAEGRLRQALPTSKLLGLRVTSRLAWAVGLIPVGGRSRFSSRPPPTACFRGRASSPTGLATTHGLRLGLGPYADRATARRPTAKPSASSASARRLGRRSDRPHQHRTRPSAPNPFNHQRSFDGVDVCLAVKSALRRSPDSYWGSWSRSGCRCPSPGFGTPCYRSRSCSRPRRAS
jgi:hypothetical protein